MRVEIRRTVDVEETYRVARAHALFNTVPEMANTFALDVDIPIERNDWRIGVVYGPSGSGKTSIAQALLESGWHEWNESRWSTTHAIIDDIAPDADFDVVTGALASVGLGTVPSWLRPYHVLSNGERFRAHLARLLLEPEYSLVFVDEFTSVLDRQVAGFGAQAFAKAWRRQPTPRQVILLTPHYDVLGWLQPDWVIQTSLTGRTVTADDVASVAPEVERPTDTPVVATVRA